MLVFNVRTDEVNMDDKDGTVARIKAKNGSVPSLKDFDIYWIGWLKLPQANQRTALLALECSNAYQANAAIEEGLVIGSELRSYRLYNRVCRILQCFNCQNYGHGTLQCVKPNACCYCGGKHRSIECKEKTTAKCAVCGENHHAYDQLCKERKREIKRIKAARLLTAEKHPTTASPPSPSIPYFSSSQTTTMHEINSTPLASTKP